MDYKADRLKKVQDIRADNQSKKKVNQLSEKHAQKFAEYYLRLGMEVIIQYSFDPILMRLSWNVR